jgi:hypothetical protein
MQLWIQIEYREEIHNIHMHAAIVKTQEHTNKCIIKCVQKVTVHLGYGT